MRNRQSYFETLSESVVELHARIDEARAVLAPEWSQDIYDRGHIAYNTHHDFNFEIKTLKDKPTRKWFHATIWRLSSGNYEVNSYIL